MTNSTLSINRLINVGVNLSPLGAQAQNISTLLVLGSSSVIDVVERYRAYTSLSGVAADFGTTAPEYLAASLYFAQLPQPTTLQIGRWAKTATAGVLKGGLISAANQAIAVWNAITSGSFVVSVDGTAHTYTGLSFAAQTNLNGVASVLQTALSGTFTGATVVWNQAYSRFEFTSGTTGTTSSVSFLTAAGSGTDISSLLAGTSASSGAYVANGIAAESALAAVTLFDNNYGQGWYALTILGAADSDHLAVAPFIEATTSKHVYGVSTQEAGVLSSVSTTDIAYLLDQLNYTRTVTQYSSSSPYAVCSLFGRILTVDYTANNSVITLMYKQEPGILPEQLSASQIGVLEGKTCNVFVAYNNSTAIIEQGKVASGDFLDTIIGTDWLALNIQTDLYNLLYTSTSKIPQTDAGNNILAAAIENRCSQGVSNGLLAPGVWQSGGFGALKQGDYLPKGFYVYAPPISTQSAADRAARKSVAFQVAAKLAGAIHTVNVTINVNR
jgi:Protein of unknown function (DUF3383)